MRVLVWTPLFAVSLLSGYWVVTVAIATWVAYWYPAWWLLVVAVLVDGYFGAFATMPILSLSIGAFVLFVEALKLYLLGTNQHE